MPGCLFYVRQEKMIAGLQAMCGFGRLQLGNRGFMLNFAGKLRKSD